jgi:precorrin-4 methylase
MQETIGMETILIHLHINHIIEVFDVLHTPHLVKNTILYIVYKTTRRDTTYNLFMTIAW